MTYIQLMDRAPWGRSDEFVVLRDDEYGSA
jgi:hypothetical protein